MEREVKSEEKEEILCTYETMRVVQHTLEQREREREREKFGRISGASLGLLTLCLCCLSRLVCLPVSLSSASRRFVDTQIHRYVRAHTLFWPGLGRWWARIRIKKQEILPRGLNEWKEEISLFCVEGCR